MLRRRLQLSLVGSAVALALLIASSHANAITIMRDPIPGAGFVDVDNGLPLILGAPVGTLLVDVVFTDMKHIETSPGATTNIEFGVGNTGNTADLAYRIIFDLSDMNGNLLTTDLLVVSSTAGAGEINIVSLDLTPLPALIFHDFHIRVETEFLDVNTGSNLFDLYVAGGAGPDGGGGAVSGPIRFNRAVVGVWVPQPPTALLALLGVAGIVIARRRRMRR